MLSWYDYEKEIEDGSRELEGRRRGERGYGIVRLCELGDELTGAGTACFEWRIVFGRWHIQETRVNILAPMKLHRGRGKEEMAHGARAGAANVVRCHVASSRATKLPQAIQARLLEHHRHAPSVRLVFSSTFKSPSKLQRPLAIPSFR